MCVCPGLELQGAQVTGMGRLGRCLQRYARLRVVLQGGECTLVGQGHASSQVLRGQGLRVLLFPGYVRLPCMRLLLLLKPTLACSAASMFSWASMACVKRPSTRSGYKQPCSHQLPRKHVRAGTQNVGSIWADLGL